MKIKNLCIFQPASGLMVKPLIVKQPPKWKHIIAVLLDLDACCYKEIGTNTTIYASRKDITPLTAHLKPKERKRRMTVEELQNWADKHTFDENSKKKIGF